MYIKVKVVPRAKKLEIIKLGDNYLKVKLVSPPIKGKANKKLISALANYYKVNKSAIKIIRGEQSREKFIEILLH